MSDLWAALALFLVLEGILPFIAPRQWRDALRALSELEEGQARLLGLAIMLTGLLALWWVRG